MLVSTLRPGGERGRDVPRPYTIQPPLPGEGGRRHTLPNGRDVFHYEPGGRLAFGLTLYAQALQLFPYVVLAAKSFETQGLGRRHPQADGRRGTLALREIWAANPLSGERQPVLEAGDQTVQVPDIPVTHDAVTACPAPAGGTPVTLRFLTPTRLIRRGKLVRVGDFHFQPLFQRLMERLESLSRDFTTTPLQFDDPKGLIAAAGRVRVVENGLAWEELRSYSTRRRASSPTSGLMGTVTVEAEDWAPFWPWLIWGQFTHVGKDAVKGNGMYGVGVGSGE
jgi:hypothetical protein